VVCRRSGQLWGFEKELEKETCLVGAGLNAVPDLKDHPKVANRMFGMGFVVQSDLG
jgi:hypothetical protein